MFAGERRPDRRTRRQLPDTHGRRYTFQEVVPA
jgi:hypothetical protein